MNCPPLSVTAGPDAGADPVNKGSGQVWASQTQNQWVENLQDFDPVLSSSTVVELLTCLTYL